MRRISLAFLVAGITAWPAWGQGAAARLEFDVASLKPVILDGRDSYMANLGTYRNGVLSQTNTTLAECIRFAYELTSDDLLSGPEWIKSKMVRFDILAKTAPETPRSKALLMLRTLLDDRFKLVLRRDSRVLSHFALTAPNGAGKLQPAPDSAPDSGNLLRPGHIYHNSMTMLRLATLISRFTQIPVVDQTGIAGDFDVKLDWARDNTLGSAALDSGVEDVAGGPSLTEAVQKQLGLKLERRKGPIDVLIVDRAEKTPLPN